MGSELDKVLMDAILQQKLYEIAAHVQRAKNEITRIKELMAEAKPQMDADLKYDKATPELNAQIASFDSFIASW